MLVNFEKIKNYVISGMLLFGLAWVVFALSFQVYFVVLVFNGDQEEMRRITNELTVRIDGNYRDNPKNIFYKGK